MTQLLIGAEPMESFSGSVLKQLQRMAERCALDTVETEALMHWASTVTETPSLSTSQQRRMLMNGYGDSSKIIDDVRLQDGILTAVLQAMPNVRYAAIVRKPGKPPKVIVYRY